MAKKVNFYTYCCSVRIKNIEETEAAKVNLLKEKMKKKDGPSEFVPANMAVNFVQHNRCKLKFFGY